VGTAEDTAEDTWPIVALNRLDDDTWVVWCDVCDRQIGNAYESEEWASELLRAHRLHH
jgi:hypothetical protein